MRGKVNVMYNARRVALRKCAGGIKTLPRVRPPRLRGLRGKAARKHLAAVCYISRIR